MIKLTDNQINGLATIVWKKKQGNSITNSQKQKLINEYLKSDDLKINVASIEEELSKISTSVKELLEHNTDLDLDQISKRDIKGFLEAKYAQTLETEEDDDLDEYEIADDIAVKLLTVQSLEELYKLYDITEEDIKKKRKK